MRPSGAGKVRLTFLTGYHGEFPADTRGTGIVNRLFAGYGPWKGAIEGRRVGALISNADGEAVHYALFYLQDRGTLFVKPPHGFVGAQAVAPSTASTSNGGCGVRLQNVTLRRLRCTPEGDQTVALQIMRRLALP